jgi:8-oxo-dGTP pyrophosphatase MutT (NUDIX family)
MIETLCENKWLSLKKIVAPEKGCQGYVFSHETRCNGNIVVILPYRHNKTMMRRDNPYDFLLRHEITPCWNIDEPVISSITGGVDPGNSPIQTARLELLEEAGYKADLEDFVFLGECYGIKSSDTIYSIYTIDLTEYLEAGEALGDGSELESKAWCAWHDSILDADDPILAMAYIKLMKYQIHDCRIF